MELKVAESRNVTLVRHRPDCFTANDRGWYEQELPYAYRCDPDLTSIQLSSYRSRGAFKASGRDEDRFSFLEFKENTFAGTTTMEARPSMT